MKKLYTTITKKNGELKDVYICVDNETAKVLEQVDEETRRIYLQEEWKMKTFENRIKRNEQSLENSLDNGFDIIDENQDIEENAIKNADIEKVRIAILQLEPQQWLVKQVYFYGRKQIEIADELGIDFTSVSKRLARIEKKLKKFLS